MSKRKDRILMCPPDYFTVDYVINPWMAGNEDSLKLDRAKAQWQRLRDTVAEFADIVTVDPDPNLPDMVFTANAGVVYGDKAIASHFMPMERRPEEPIFKQWFRTEIEAHPVIQAFFDIELVSIRLTDERFYHIDTCFCPLTDGFLMYHPPAFDYDSRIAIESRIPPHKRIIVDTFDAGNFACNATTRSSCTGRPIP